MVSKVVLLLVVAVACAALGASATNIRIASACASTDVMLMELSAKLPSQNRWAGDPCTDNSQCASGKCACVDGGRHCVNDKDCPADGDWPATHAGQLATLRCSNGTEGTRVRKCEADGEWSDESDTCKGPVCHAEDEWPETRVTETATLGCPTGNGTRTRKCLSGGRWDTPVSNCRGPECPETEGWPATPVGTHAQLECAQGLVGFKSRFCTESGVWQVDVKNGCKEPGCPVDGQWPATDKKTFATLPCVDNDMKGEQRRFCQEDGSWGDAKNACYRVCEAVSPWPETRSGDTASLVCGDGFTGEKKRDCRDDGTWSEIQNHCEEVAAGCPADGDWPVTSPGVEAVVSCQHGMSGDRYRFCSTESMWEDEYDGDCVSV